MKGKAFQVHFPVGQLIIPFKRAKLQPVSAETHICVYANSYRKADPIFFFLEKSDCFSPCIDVIFLLLVRLSGR